MSETHSSPPRRVGIVTDSSCDLPDDLIARWAIAVVPLTIRFGDDDLVDREELSTDEFWQRTKSASQLPSTAAPAPGRFEAAYRACAEQGVTDVLTITLSAALSATMQSAELGARGVVDDGINVKVIDSRSVTLGLGTIVLACAERAGGGATLDELTALADDLIGRTRVFGALDTLDNLRKGGRIGNAKALLATALSIKPIIEIDNGVVEQRGKQRTRAKALTFLVDKLATYEGHIEHLAVLHADCDDVGQFVDRLRPHYPGDIVIGEIGPVIGTHAGRGTIGVAFHETVIGGQPSA